MIVAARDVLQLHAEETLLELAHLLEVGGHVTVLGLVALVGEVDEELGIALDGYALDPQGDRGPEPGEEALIFSDVVGDLVVMLEA